MNLSFTLANGAISQNGVQYAIRLIKETDSEQTIFDEKVFPEKIDISPKASISKSIVYSAPTNAAGNFSLWIEVRNAWGATISMASFGKVQLSASGESVELKKCAVRVGDDKSQVWGLNFGVDIASDEQLILVCNAENKSSHRVQLTPEFTTRRWSVFGAVVKAPTTQNNAITLEAKELKQISILVPTAQNPQAYNAEVMLVSGSDIISNKITLHYVIRGESATIQNINLDKADYQQGEIAHITAYITPSADIFADSRGSGTEPKPILAEYRILDSLNSACSDKEEKNIDPAELGTAISLDVPINKKCIGAVISIVAKSQSGSVLDANEYKVKESGSAPAANEIVVNESKNKHLWLALLVAVIIIVGIIVVMRKRNLKTPNILMFLVIFAVSMSFGAHIVRADSFVVPGGPMPPPPYGGTYPNIVRSCKAISYPTCDSRGYCCAFDDVWPYGPVFIGNGNCSSYDINNFNGYSCYPGTNGLYSVSLSGYMASGSGTDATYVVNLDKSQYAPGENMMLVASSTGSYCNNGHTTARLTAKNGNQWKVVIDSGNSWSTQYSAVAIFTAPSTPGTYSLRTYGFAYLGHFYLGSVAAYDLAYTVKAPAPLVDLKINDSNGPIDNFPQNGMRNFSWTVDNADANTVCTASSNNIWSGAKSLTLSGTRGTGAESLAVSITGTINHTLTCTNSVTQQTGSDSVQVKVPCTPEEKWGECQCSAGSGYSSETKHHTKTDVSCNTIVDEYVACTPQEKNSCRDFNWKEVAP